MNKEHTHLTSAQNERVKLWSSLLDKKSRDRHSLFVIEGIHLLKEAIKAKAQIESIVYDAERGIPKEIMDCKGDVPTYTEWFSASKSIMGKCTGTDSPPPIFAIVGKFNANAEAAYRENGLVIVLDGVRDPGNVGTIIRSADATGAEAVILGKGCVDLYNPKTVRSTMGSLFHLPIIEGNLDELIPLAKKKGQRIVGTSLQASHHCFNYDWNQGIWLVMGSEGDGLSPTVMAHVDDSIIIPMAGSSESLNVAMATTVLLYEALRQRKYS